MPAPRVSFEFFPAADDIMAATPWCTVRRLASLQPTFVSVTSAADAATRARTRHWVGRLLRETALAVAPISRVSAFPGPKCWILPGITSVWACASWWRQGEGERVAPAPGRPAATTTDGRPWRRKVIGEPLMLHADRQMARSDRPAPVPPEVERICGQCHSFESVTRVHRTPRQGEARIKAMVAQGPKVREEDFAAYAAYLTQHDGAQPQERAP